MFRKVDKVVVEDFISRNQHYVKSKTIFLKMCIVATDNLTGSINSNYLDFLLVGWKVGGDYLLLPWPKSIFRYIFVILALFGLLSACVGAYLGVIFVVVTLYIGSKIVAFPIDVDLPFKTKSKR